MLACTALVLSAILAILTLRRVGERSTRSLRSLPPEGEQASLGTALREADAAQISDKRVRVR